MRKIPDTDRRRPHRNRLIPSVRGALVGGNSGAAGNLIHRSGDRDPKLDRLMEACQLHVRQDHRKETPTWTRFRDRIIPNPRPSPRDPRNESGGKPLVGPLVVVQCQTYLLEIVSTLHTSSRLPGSLDGREQKPD